MIDVTLRDGGYVNGHTWTVEQAETVVRACAAAGVPYAEVGYLRPARRGVDGDRKPSASSPPDYLARVNEAAGGTGLVVMAHAADILPEDLAALPGFGVRLVRMPTQPGDVLDLEPYVDAAHDAGMAFSANLIRISELSRDEVVAAAEQAGKVNADVFYIADSNGSLFPDAVAGLMNAVRQVSLTALGMHAHDGLSMAFANTLAAVREGAEFVDASLCGMGKGGGNLASELIAGYLQRGGHARLRITPLVEAADALLAPWKGSSIGPRCEAVVSGLLDLNMEQLEVIRRQGAGEVFALFDIAPRQV